MKRIVGKRYGEFDGNMLKGYLKYYNLRMSGVVLILKMRVLLHFNCSNLPLLFTARHYITPCFKSLVLQRIAQLFIVDPTIFGQITKLQQTPFSPLQDSVQRIPIWEKSINQLQEDFLKIGDGKFSTFAIVILMP